MKQKCQHDASNQEEDATLGDNLKGTHTERLAGAQKQALVTGKVLSSPR